MTTTQILLDEYRANPTDAAFEKLYEHFKCTVRAVVLNTLDDDVRGRVRITEIVDTALRNGIPVVAEADVLDVRAFLNGVAKRKAWNARRGLFADKRDISREVKDPETVQRQPSNEDSPANDLEMEEFWRIITDYFASLPIEERLIAQLRVIDGCKVPDIREALSELGHGSYTISTIQRRAKRIHEQVKLQLLNAGYGPEQE